jgi:hypothetical protein
MYIDFGISFTDDRKEVSYVNGSLVAGINEYSYTAIHVPSCTTYTGIVYVLGGLEEVCHLLNEWNKVNPDIWQYSLNTLTVEGD